jgi:hypothetical protein
MHTLWAKRSESNAKYIAHSCIALQMLTALYECVSVYMLTAINYDISPQLIWGSNLKWVSE